MGGQKRLISRALCAALRGIGINTVVVAVKDINRDIRFADENFVHIIKKIMAALHHFHISD